LKNSDEKSRIAKKIKTLEEIEQDKKDEENEIDPRVRFDELQNKINDINKMGSEL
jgi:hypothetical protein